MLGGVAVPGDRLLDLGRPKLIRVDAAGLGGQQHHPAGVGHDDGRPHVPGVREELLDHDQVGADLADQRAEVVMELDEAIGHRHLRVEAEDPALDEPRIVPRRIQLDTPVARHLQTGVDPEDSHGGEGVRD